jgi:hypothetical protein
MNEDEKMRIWHDTLLSEIHNIDDIAEKHTQVVMAISAALVAFASAQWSARKVVGLVRRSGALHGSLRGTENTAPFAVQRAGPVNRAKCAKGNRRPLTGQGAP